MNLNPAEQKLANLSLDDLIYEAEKVRTKLQAMDYRGCYWDAGIIAKLMTIAIDSKDEQS